jgi:hypothetical protein
MPSAAINSCPYERPLTDTARRRRWRLDLADRRAQRATSLVCPARTSLWVPVGFQKSA